MRNEDSGGTPVISRTVPRPAHRGPQPAQLRLADPVRPEPLPLDLVRRDIAGDRAGVPLMLRIRVLHEVSGFPVPAAVVDIRHRDPDGTTEMRGAQVTDADGYAEFRTLHPGRENGQAVRIDAAVHIGGVLAGGRAITYSGPLFVPEQIAGQIAGPAAEELTPDRPTTGTPHAGSAAAHPTAGSVSRVGFAAAEPAATGASRIGFVPAGLAPAGGVLTVVPRDRFDLTAGLLATVTVTVGD